MNRPILFWIWLAGFFVFLAIQIPGLGNVDTARRLQFTRSLWTSEPAVRVEDVSDYGVLGRDGVVHPFGGVGQSLVMLPADLVAAVAERFARSPEEALKIRSGGVATLTFPALNATTLVIIWLWLARMGFSEKERLAGVFSFLFGTTFFNHGQVHMENSLQDLLLIADAWLLWRWMDEGRLRDVALAAGTVGFAVLVRLTSLAEHGGLWVGVLAWILVRRDLRLLSRIQQVALVAPIVLAGLLVDRAIHFHRFGQWTGTYINLFGAQSREGNPGLSAEYPFNGSFWEGALGPLFAPHVSVFLYDPLVILLLAACLWRGREVWPALLGAGIGFVALDLFYARYVFWDGGLATWGNRYTLAPVHLVLPLALPLAWRCGWGRSKVVWLLCSLSVVVQLLSVTMPAVVERAQSPRLVLLDRVVNLVRKVSGEGPPAGVPAALWRINLFPATLGSKAAWIGWFGFLGMAAFCVRKAVVVTNRPEKCN